MSHRPIKKPSIAGPKNPNWKGGEIVTKDGRVMIHSPNHPHHSKGRYVYRYRLLFEESLGRFLEPDEVIHHINGIVDDDRLENLEMMPAIQHNRLSAHTLFNQMRWSYEHEKCINCGTTDHKHKGHGLCSRCNDRRRWPERYRRLKNRRKEAA